MYQCSAQNLTNIKEARQGGHMQLAYIWGAVTFASIGFPFLFSSLLFFKRLLLLQLNFPFLNLKDRLEEIS